MAGRSAPIFFLCCLAFLAIVSFAQVRCPNKCLPSKRKAVAQCRVLAASLRRQCESKRCPNRHKWKCAQKREPPIIGEVACKPVRHSDSEYLKTFYCGNFGCDPQLSIEQRLSIFSCTCGGTEIQSSEAFIVSDFKTNKDTKCYENCMKDRACLGGACTLELEQVADLVCSVVQ